MVAFVEHCRAAAEKMINAYAESIGESRELVLQSILATTDDALRDSDTSAGSRELLQRESVAVLMAVLAMAEMSRQLAVKEV